MFTDVVYNNLLKFFKELVFKCECKRDMNWNFFVCRNWQTDECSIKCIFILVSFSTLFAKIEKDKTTTLDLTIRTAID